MKLNRCILDNKGLSYYIDKKFQSSLITRKLNRLEQYFPGRIRELKDSLSDISIDTVETLENNVPVRYVAPGIYINGYDTSVIDHNIEDINSYLTIPPATISDGVDMNTLRDTFLRIHGNE